MQKDPKRVLESLRIEEEDPLLHHRPRKFRKRKNELSQVSNTAILSLCLVTGLSSGVGSAFANSLDGNTPNKAPLDEPPSKVEQDKNVELPQMKAPQTKSSEIMPNNPPLDEPASKNTKQPDNSEKNHKHIEKGNSETSESQKKEEAELKQNQEQKNPKEEPKNETNQQKVQEKTPKNEQSTKPIENEKSTQSHSKSKKYPQSNEKSVTPPTNSVHESNTQPESEKTEEKESSTEWNQTQQSDILLPQTEEGGELPKTAGNDLNQAALGAGVALAGAVLLRRKRENSQ